MCNSCCSSQSPGNKGVCSQCTLDMPSKKNWKMLPSVRWYNRLPKVAGGTTDHHRLQGHAHLANQLCKNAPHTPHVHWRGVVRCSQLKVYSTYGASQGVAWATAHLVRVALDGDTEGTAQAQVCNFHTEGCIVHQQVLGLEITVQNTMLVAVCQPLDQLVGQVLQQEK